MNMEIAQIIEDFITTQCPECVVKASPSKPPHQNDGGTIITAHINKKQYIKYHTDYFSNSKDRAINIFECIKLIVAGYNVTLWPASQVKIGPRAMTILIDSFENSRWPWQWQYDSGGLSFDLREPDSLDKLRTICRALVDDTLESFSKLEYEKLQTPIK